RGERGGRGGRGPRKEGGRGGERRSSVPERSYVARDVDTAAPVAPKRTERVDDFADLGFGKIEL
ncbi:MAG: RNA-binding protein, partial [Faecalibacterium sp.]|nr:RNA-binding protein [Faecalibacterium sp.]